LAGATCTTIAPLFRLWRTEMNVVRGQLINVSNRLPVQLKKYAGGMRMTPSSGGLASALDSVWKRQTGTWIGWAGKGDAEQSEQLLAGVSKKRPYTLRGVILSDDEVAKFYSGFANEIIWPLFHDFPSRCNFDPDYWEVYQQVNRKFAKVTAEVATSDGDFIWAHDYHLMLMAQQLRERGSVASNGFFLHIPFPAPGMFEKLPWRESILRGLLHYDLLGFQSNGDRDNFVDCLGRLLPAAIVKPGPLQNLEVSFEDRPTIMGAFPISVDFEEFAGRAASSSVAAKAASLRQEMNENVLVLGVDRLDYTKGIPERLKAFRIFLRRFPEWRHKIALMQVVVPSREDIQNYKDVRREVELLVTQINGEFTEPGWIPIHYLHRNLNRDELLAYYRAADIALVTSLKDGMNLVAKEFCAAQVDERGVLIISEFAGAAPELHDGAIVVNPNDFLGVAQALHDACMMPPEEKRKRMQGLRNIIKENDVARWAESFLASVPSLR
jgi:alpha,alpha-trehalose-phosphate synthase [UDP-forming]